MPRTAGLQTASGCRGRPARDIRHRRFSTRAGAVPGRAEFPADLSAGRAQCSSSRQSAGTRPSGPGAGWSSGRANGGLSGTEGADVSST